MNTEFLVIGGGIVGLTTAFELTQRFPESKVVVLEKERQLAQHQTGRNSGVIHSGIYYRPGSLKAQTCVKGVEILKNFCREHKIAMEETGKVIVATEENEIPRLQVLHQRGQENAVPGVEMIDEQTLKEIEPYAKGLQALWVPSTAIVDYPGVCQKLREIITSRGAEVLTSQHVVDITRSDSGIVVHTKNTSFSCGYLFNCAGLFADRIAHMAKVNTTIKIIPFRGEYYKTIPGKEYFVRGLIYPVPDPSFPFLGVHFTKMVNGSVEAGPNAVLALKREGYSKTSFSVKDTSDIIRYSGFWKLALQHWKQGFQEIQRSFSKRLFVKSLQKLIPKITAKDLVPYKSGVRAQAVTPEGKMADDFCVVHSAQMIHVLNAPSPAATASFEIARQIVDMAFGSRN